MDDQQFGDLLKQIKQIVGDGKLTSEQLIILTPRIILLIQSIPVYQGMSDAEKKALFLNVVKKIVTTVQMDDNERQILLTFVDTLLPHIYDAAVYAYRSDELQNLEKKASSWWKAHCCTN